MPLQKTSMRTLNYYALIAAGNGAVLVASLIYWMARVALSSSSSAGASDIQEIPSDYSEDDASSNGRPIDLGRTQIIHHIQATSEEVDHKFFQSDPIADISSGLNGALIDRDVPSQRGRRSSEEESMRPISSASLVKSTNDSSSGLSNRTVTREVRGFTSGQKKITGQSESKLINDTLTLNQLKPSVSGAPARPVIKQHSRIPRDPPNVDHVRKSNIRVNMSFDNKRYWEISSANQILAKNIQNVKPTYSRMPEQPKYLRSKLELKQTTGFFAFQRDNMRIANRIMSAKPTVPSARPQSASRIPSRPSSSLSRSTAIEESRRPQSGSRGQSRRTWGDNF